MKCNLINLKTTTLFLIILTLISCNEISPFEKELTKENNCWILTDNYPCSCIIKKEIYGGNSFLINGEIEEIWVVNGVKEKNFKFEDLNNKKNSWDFNEDNILSFYDYKFKVLKFSKDSIIVENVKNHKKQCFINFPHSVSNIP